MKLYNYIIIFIFMLNLLNAEDINFTKEESNYIEVSTIKVAMVPNIHPFNMYENGKLDGFSYDVLNLISKKSGLNFDFEIDNWSYNLKKSRNEKINNSANNDFARANYDIPLAIFSTKDLENYNNMKSIKNTKPNNKNLFYKNDANDGNLFEIIGDYGLSEKLRALMFWEVDLIIGPLLNVQANILKNGYSNIKVLSKLKLPLISKEDLRFGISKDNKLLYSIIQKTFNKITKKEWADINKKWTDVYLSKNVVSIIDSIILTNKEKEYLKNKKILRICINSDFAPFNFLDKDRKLKGLSIDTLELIKNYMNIVLSYKITKSIDESLVYLESGLCDIIPSVDKNELFSKDIDFTQTYLNYKFAIITKKENPIVINLDSIMNEVLPIKKDSVFHKKIKSNFPNAKVLETNSHHKALQLVNNNSTGFTILALPIASYYISKYTMSDLYISLYTDISYDIKMAVRSEDKVLMSLLNKSLNQISAKQKKEISNKWINISIKEAIDYSFIFSIFGIFFILLLILTYRHNILNKHNKELKKAHDETKQKSLELELLSNSLEQKVKEEVALNEQKTKHLIQQSRLAQMGELLSMIAHQWRQPLSYLSTTANYILVQSFLEKPLNKKELENEVSLIVEYSKHLSSTISDFKDFYKIDKVKTKISLEDIANKSINIIKSSYEVNDIKLTRNYECLKEIYTYSSEVNQVILNLLKNSEDAFLENKIKSPQVIINTYFQENKVYLELIDNAGGVKEEYLSKLFDPYFSTKKAKDGSGLGLYMCKTIIEDHCGGSLSVVNNSEGTTFMISISI